MEEVTLQALLEAGCHFGHKAERWHPKAAEFIYTKKDGIHIIDLAKTKLGLEAAMAFVTQTVTAGGEVLFVGTKRQAKGVLIEETKAVAAPYLGERWIGGFLTNWDNIHKNIEKINRMTNEQAAGSWKKFPKHEQMKMAHYLTRIKVYYGGVLTLDHAPAALFVVDVRKEIAAVREAKRRGIPVVAIVDTNADPEEIEYAIPANDDAVGSISYIVHAIAEAYREGKALAQKGAEMKAEAAKKESAPSQVDQQPKAAFAESSGEPKEALKAPEEPKKKPDSASPSAKAAGDKKATPGKRGRPKKTT